MGRPALLSTPGGDARAPAPRRHPQRSEERVGPASGYRHGHPWPCMGESPQSGIPPQARAGSSSSRTTGTIVWWPVQCSMSYQPIRHGTITISIRGPTTGPATTKVITKTSAEIRRGRQHRMLPACITGGPQSGGILPGPAPTVRTSPQGRESIGVDLPMDRCLAPASPHNQPCTSCPGARRPPLREPPPGFGGHMARPLGGACARRTTSDPCGNRRWRRLRGPVQWPGSCTGPVGP